MEYYGLDNFLWNACKEYPKQYKYSPALHRQTADIHDVTPKRIGRNPIHLLCRPSPALSQVAAWSSIHPMEEGFTDHQLVIGDFVAVPKVPLQALPIPRPVDIDLSNKDQKIKYANAVNASYFAKLDDIQQLTPQTYEHCEAIMRNDDEAICKPRHHSSGVPHPGWNPRYIAFMHHHKFLKKLRRMYNQLLQVKYPPTPLTQAKTRQRYRDCTKLKSYTTVLINIWKRSLERMKTYSEDEIRELMNPVSPLTTLPHNRLRSAEYWLENTRRSIRRYQLRPKIPRSA